jgi:hypothetical protein
MKQEKIKEQLLELHNAIAGKVFTSEQIVENRTIEPDFSLRYYGELGGLVPVNTVSNNELVKKYGRLRDKLDCQARTST